jgi:indole-3-glycerol phosphate synthase
MPRGAKVIDLPKEGWFATLVASAVGLAELWRFKRETSEQAKQERAADTVAYLREEFDFSPDRQIEINERTAKEIGEVKQASPSLNDYVRGELPEAIARRITQNGARLHVDSSKD